MYNTTIKNLDKCKKEELIILIKTLLAERKSLANKIKDLNRRIKWK